MPFGFGDTVAQALSRQQEEDKMSATTRVKPIAHFFDVLALHLNPNKTNGALEKFQHTDDDLNKLIQNTYLTGLIPPLHQVIAKKIYQLLLQSMQTSSLAG